MNELNAVAKMQPREGSRFLLFTIFFLILFLGVWASISEIEELARGEGQVVPSAEIQVVQSLEGGIVEEILVKEGERVEKGQVLLRLSDVFFASEERGTEARLLSLQAKKARLEAEVGDKEFSLPQDIEEKIPDVARNELALYQSRAISALLGWFVRAYPSGERMSAIRAESYTFIWQPYVEI